MSYAGTVRAIHVAPGDAVQSGTALVDVYAPELAVAAARVRGTDREAAVHQERLDALQTLHGEGLARVDDLHEVEHEVARLRSERGVAEAALASAGLDAAQRRQLRVGGWYTLRAPLAGVVEELNARRGMSFEPGAELVSIAGTPGAVRVQVELAEPPPPGPAQLLTRAGAVALTPVSAGAIRDPQSGLWRGWYEPHGEATLRHGERWPVRWETADDSGAAAALGVPARALSTRDGSAVVLRQRDGDRARVRVEVLHIDETQALIAAGGELAEGDEVAVDPALVLGVEDDGESP